MYLTYDDYRIYGGTLDETAFNSFAFEASAQIDWYTFNRLQNVEYEELNDKVKLCMFQIISRLKDIQDFQSGGASASSSNTTGYVQTIASQENDGVSISYNTIPASECVDLAKSDIQRLIKIYLQGVTNELGRKVLYKGIYPDE